MWMSNWRVLTQLVRVFNWKGNNRSFSTYMGVTLRKWKSSEGAVLARIPKSLREPEMNQEIHYHDEYTKVLGLEWNMVLDCFCPMTPTLKFDKILYNKASYCFDHCLLVQCYWMVISHNNSNEDLVSMVVGTQFDVGRNKNNSRFCHSPVLYLARVLNTH